MYKLPTPPTPAIMAHALTALNVFAGLETWSRSSTREKVRGCASCGWDSWEAKSTDTLACKIWSREKTSGISSKFPARRANPWPTACKALPQPQSSEPAKADPPNERRRFTRHPCLGTAEFRISGNYTRLSGKLTDVSLGGCYIQALGTCLLGTRLDLELEACGLKISLDGRVVVAASSRGMGVEFVSGCEGLKQLPKFIAAVRRHYTSMPTRPAVEVRGKQSRPV